MIRKLLFLLSAFAFVFTSSQAQVSVCGTDIMHRKLLKEHPELAPQIAAYNAQLEAGIKAQVSKIDLNKLARTSSWQADTDDIKRSISPDSILWIPVVVHVIHNYGQEDISDNAIATLIKTLNDYYQLKNDTSGVIQPFKKYVGKANIGYKLASKDPNGNPTKGITRYYSYTTYGGDDQAKFQLWSTSNYLNIWIENVIGLAAEGSGVVAAYSQLPPDGASRPWVDGLICAAPYTGAGTEDYVIAHEVGHYLNLLHPFGSNNSGSPAEGCGDDEVDDTPPTTGEFGVACNLYDTTCATGYVKIYPSSVPGIDSLADYPDTVNVQNIMTYSSCLPELMFTKGQVARMRACLNNDIANRNNLWIDSNHYRTGAMDATPDLPVVVDYSVSSSLGTSSSNPVWPALASQFGLASTYNGLITFENTAGVNFKNQSWNDTVQSVSWAFSNGATPATSTSLTLANNVKFSQPGWVTVTMQVKGNNTATQTLTDSQKLFVVDANATNPNGYIQEFNANADIAKWPTFNYYNNNFKWQLNNSTGYYDNTCMEYVGYDARQAPPSLTGPAFIPATRIGDYDDMFTPLFDLTQLGNANSVYLTFMYSGATRAGVSADISDSLEIAYNNSLTSPSWKTIAVFSKGTLDNQGALAIPYQPQWQGQWSQKIVQIPAAAYSANTILRFRYKPRVGSFGQPTGNNFFIDRISFTSSSTGVDAVTSPADMHVSLAPNPTNGSTTVIVADAAGAKINVQVTDITGKVVYSTQRENVNSAAPIEIPHSAISVSGIYLVHVATSNQVRTEKLVVY